MIATIRGVLAEKTPDIAVVESGGLGYRLAVTLHTFYDLPEVGAEARLLVHTHMWSDGIALYGFSRAEEREMFLRLVAVSGIGPRLARNVLSGIRVASLSEALRTGDLARIKAVPGVGKRLAERILVEMRDKEARLPAAEKVAGGVLPADPTGSQVVSALVNLGYKPEAAQRALAQVRTGETATDDLEALLRAALKALTK